MYSCFCFVADFPRCWHCNCHDRTGEIIIRRSLEKALAMLGAAVTVIRSDAEFMRSRMNGFDIIILDPWTWAAKGLIDSIL